MKDTRKDKSRSRFILKVEKKIDVAMAYDGKDSTDGGDSDQGSG